ncbi:NAD(P)H-binding protein [Nocardia amamiensis]|uniref:NAD(P)H-binding protein n=1 Tax=Nocardia amamiensis TaxID=404578 RepID=A0ABS0CV47_9NOCA|nr:NAD(P)H-binding protein [Nocardia amamiensis]
MRQFDSAAPETNSLYLVTAVCPRKREGASPTGIVGRSLARRLLAAGARVRVLTEPGQDEGWPADVELLLGSITSPSDCATALPGVEAMFLAGAIPSTVEDVLALASAAGLRRIALLSSHGPEYEQEYPPETWFWLVIERAVERSGIAWTHIRPSAVMGSAIEGTYPATGSDWPDTIGADSVVREAFADTGHYPFIHEDDLAAVAAAALTTDNYTGTVIEAVGPPLSTRARILSIARAIRRDVGHVELTPDQSRAIWRRNGWPPGAIDVTLYALQEYTIHLAALTQWTRDQRPSVQEIIGRPPRTFDEWAVEHAGLFR